MYTNTKNLVVRALGRADLAAGATAQDSAALWQLRRIDPCTAVARARAACLLAALAHETANNPVHGADWLERIQAASAGAVALAKLARMALLAQGGTNGNV